MTKNQKNDIVSSLTEEFKASSAVVVCSYKGLSHSNLESLRQKAVITIPFVRKVLKVS